MREIRSSGSEGGVADNGHPYPYQNDASTSRIGSYQDDASTSGMRSYEGLASNA
jgi:hypothetical protein